jgi:hypothetical protein
MNNLNKKKTIYECNQSSHVRFQNFENMTTIYVKKLRQNIFLLFKIT